MKARLTRRSVPHVISLFLIIFVLVGVLSVVPVIRELQVRLIDTLCQWVPVPKQRFRVMVVLIDDDSLQKYGSWPWSRELLARLIDNLTRHAGTIGLDILLSEPQSPTADLALRKPGLVSGKNCVPIRTHC